VANTGPSWKPRRSRRGRRKSYGFAQHPSSWMRKSRKRGKRNASFRGRTWTMRSRGKRDWKGQPRRHAKASSLGWRRTAKRGWRPKWKKSGRGRRY
jgi:hypothetical protein